MSSQHFACLKLGVCKCIFSPLTKSLQSLNLCFQLFFHIPAAIDVINVHLTVECHSLKAVRHWTVKNSYTYHWSRNSSDLSERTKFDDEVNLWRAQFTLRLPPSYQLSFSKTDYSTWKGKNKNLSCKTYLAIKPSNCFVVCYLQATKDCYLFTIQTKRNNSVPRLNCSPMLFPDQSYP